MVLSQVWRAIFRRPAQVFAAVPAALALWVLLTWAFGQAKSTSFGPGYVPMTPSTAGSILLVGCAMLACHQWPSARISRILARVAAFGAAGCGLWVCAQATFGLEWPFGPAPANAAERIGDIPLGRMSPLTAAALVLTALALALESPGWNGRWWRRQTASLLALATLSISVVVVLSYAAGVPLLYGTQTIPMALLTSIALASLGLGLLVDAGADTFPRSLFQTAPDFGPAPSRQSVVAGQLLAFLLLALGIGAVGYRYFMHQIAASRQAAENELSAIADLKAQQIMDWRKELLDDAEQASHDPICGQYVKEFLARPAHSPWRPSLQAWLRSFRENNEGLRALLLDPEMNVRLAVPEEKTYFGPIAQSFAREALRTGQVVVSDLHASRFTGEIHFDLAIPIGKHRLLHGANGAPTEADGPRAVAVIVVEVDPNKFLFPRMQQWPTPSPTAETFLVRREGDEAVFLNPLRDGADAALSLRTPLDRKGAPAVEAALGREGIMEGANHRDVPVLAFLRAIPGTSWSIVAKVDQSEIYAPLRERGLTTAVLAMVFVALAAVSVAFLGRRHDNHRLQSQLAVEREHRMVLDAAEEELSQKNQELLQLNAVLADRHAALEKALLDAQAATVAKSHFLANMSHEIRTPMTAILGYADLLSDAATTAKERDDFIAVIRRNGNHLLQIINDILDLSKIEAGKTALELAPCNLPALISDVASVVRPSAAKRGLALEIEYRGSVPEEIVTDRLRLRQALVNLVGNAVKFTEKGGVTIAVGLLPAGLQGQPALKIDVIDTGIGIAPEVLPSLFQPFVQADASTSRRFGGTGLGLAIIHRLVTLMGGEVHAESTLGRGSAFTLLVPTGDVAGVRMVRGAAEAISPAPDACAGFARELAGVSVLVAEDGHDNQELIRLLLDGAGAAVEIVDNGRLAVEKALSQPFDVVLMDIQMPVMDGYQATRMLRERGYQGPILAITAHAMDCDRRECLAAGCNVHLSKPLDRALLTKTIAEHVRKAPAAPFAGSPVPQEAEPEPVT